MQILGGEKLLEKCSGVRGALSFSDAFRIVFRILFRVFFLTFYRIDIIIKNVQGQFRSADGPCIEIASPGALR